MISKIHHYMYIQGIVVLQLLCVHLEYISPKPIAS